MTEPGAPRGRRGAMFAAQVRFTEVWFTEARRAKTAPKRRASGPGFMLGRGLVIGLAFGLALAAGAGAAFAADLGYAPYVPPPPPPAYAQAPAPPADYGVDPRCRVVGMPQANLAGDTARFRPTAICQSRGLYTDSVIFPGPPVVYRPPPYAIPGYSYGYVW